MVERLYLPYFTLVEQRAVSGFLHGSPFRADQPQLHFSQQSQSPAGAPQMVHFIFALLNSASMTAIIFRAVMRP